MIWELKSAQIGLHDWRNTYSLFNPTQAHYELDYRGTELLIGITAIRSNVAICVAVSHNWLAGLLLLGLLRMRLCVLAKVSIDRCDLNRVIILAIAAHR